MDEEDLASVLKMEDTERAKMTVKRAMGTTVTTPGLSSKPGYQPMVATEVMIVDATKLKRRSFG
jgi:hypothetical protein